MTERSYAYRAVSGIASVIAAAIVLIDMVLGPIFRPLTQMISRSSSIGVLRTFSRRLPAYVALFALAVPLAVAEPAKIFALYLIGEEHYISGVVLLCGAYLVSLVLVDTIYEGARPQLRSITWFSSIVDQIARVRFTVMTAIRESRPYGIARTQTLRFRAWFGRRLARASQRP